jgi:hypothetical protein
MATSYEVRLHVQPRGSVTSLKDALTRTLAGSDRFDRAPEIEQRPDDDPTLLVTMWLAADDASTAQQEGAAAIRSALDAAGLDQDDARIGDASTRSSS